MQMFGVGPYALYHNKTIHFFLLFLDQQYIYINKIRSQEFLYVVLYAKVPIKPHSANRKKSLSRNLFFLYAPAVNADDTGSTELK